MPSKTRYIKKTDVSRAEDKFAQFLRNLDYRISVQVPMYYLEFEPKYDCAIMKCHRIDIVLDDYILPTELLGPHHLKQRQEIKDERIFEEVERQYGKKPVLIHYDGKAPSLKKMREWLTLIEERTEQ